MRNNPNVKPDWQIVKWDLTAYFDAEYLNDMGVRKVGVYYLVDANLHVHICSFTPSLEGWALHAWTELRDDCEHTEAVLEAAGEVERVAMIDEGVDYYGLEMLNNPKRPATDFADAPTQDEGEEDEAYRRRVVEEVRDHVAGNPIYF